MSVSVDQRVRERAAALGWVEIDIDPDRTGDYGWNRYRVRSAQDPELRPLTK